MANKTESVPVKHEERRRGVLDTPWEPFSHLRDEMDRLFDDFAGRWPWAPARRHRRTMTEPFGGMLEPFRGWGSTTAAVDVVDKGSEIQVRAELPGMNEDDIDIRLADGLLTISGEKKEEKEEGEEGGDYYLSERRYGSFQRSFRIPDGIDPDKVAATFKKGVLTVSLPKTKEAQERTRKIKVKTQA